MKEAELQKHTKCDSCRRPVLASGLPLFWRVTIERFGIDMQAVQRQQGLTMMLGGHAMLAAAMGPDEDMAVPVMDKVTRTLCETCAVDHKQIIAVLAMSDA